MTVDAGRSMPPNLASFRRDGVVALSSVIEPGTVEELRRHFWSEVEQQYSICEDAPETWPDNRDHRAGGSGAVRLPGMNPIMERLKADGRLADVQTAMQEVIDATFGSNRWQPLDKWYSLLTFPGTDSEWTIPNRSWHNDQPIVVGDHEPWSIFAFVFLDSVRRDTGPTVVVTGSHRRGELLANASSVHDEREVLAFDDVNHELVHDPAQLELLRVGELLPRLASTDAWFGELVEGEPGETRIEQLMGSGTTHEGIESRVVDLTAEPGDVILLDPRCLHSASSNISTHPRQVLRLDFRRTPR